MKCKYRDQHKACHNTAIRTPEQDKSSTALIEQQIPQFHYYVHKSYPQYANMSQLKILSISLHLITAILIKENSLNPRLPADFPNFIHYEFLISPTLRPTSYIKRMRHHHHHHHNTFKARPYRSIFNGLSRILFLPVDIS